MNKYLTISVLSGMLLAGASCKKVDDGDYCMTPDAPARKVRYELFTNRDFSGNQDTIRFDLVMARAEALIFDSALAPMRIEDIPDSLHRIIMEKLVPDGIPDSLAVGFNYAIDDVGFSGFKDIFPAGDTLKIVRFSFD
ncbi:MAG TPA: hypothetical protein VN616_09895 [Puia sp.]|nr:hypothetical protein [Puia sp.]